MCNKLRGTQRHKKTLLTLRAQTDTKIVIMGDLNTPVLPTDRSSRQKSAKKLQSYSIH
jgi:hypothetical protein